MRKPVSIQGNLAPKSPYSPAILADGKLLFISGQGPSDPKSGEMLLGSFEEQARLVFSNVGALLEAGGSAWSEVVMTRVFLSERKYFSEMNHIYKDFAVAPFPARTTVAVELPHEGMLIEVDCIARVP